MHRVQIKVSAEIIPEKRGWSQLPHQSKTPWKQTELGRCPGLVSVAAINIMTKKEQLGRNGFILSYCKSQYFMEGSWGRNSRQTLKAETTGDWRSQVCPLPHPQLVLLHSPDPPASGRLCPQRARPFCINHQLRKCPIDQSNLCNSSAEVLWILSTW